MKKRILRLGLWLCLIVGLAMSFWKLYNVQKAKRVYGEAMQIAGLSKEDDTWQGQMDFSEGHKGQEKEDLPYPGTEASEEMRNEKGNVDLEALKEVNPEVIGWIAIPATTLSYPLLQGQDNQYYLNHNWKKEVNSSGAIFLESTNNRDFSDFHTIIYGHRMRDNSMFGILKSYESLDFWREHPNIYVAVEDNIYCYRIFAAHETSITSLVYRLDLEEEGLEEEFLQFCIDHSILALDKMPEWEGQEELIGKQILTLSTCTGLGHTTRWVVQGYLLQN